MAVSQIEEKILGRLAKQVAPKNALLSSSLYQILGLSILLSRKLYRARRLRRLDITRDTKSLQLYHHIIWLAREGLSITEVYILPYCQNGEQGIEYRVMAAKLRASFYYIFCLYHNHPPVNRISKRSNDSDSTSPNAKTPRPRTDLASASPPRSGSSGKDREGGGTRRNGKPPLRDPIPSMTSDTSYVTNPFAGPSRSPPTADMFPLPPEPRRTPHRPPGLTPINIPPAQAAASFLLPPLNFVPMAKEHFELVHDLATRALPATHALRLSVALEYAAFIWDCERDPHRSRRLARKTVKLVFASSDPLDDDEYADASVMVQALTGIVQRGSNESTPQTDPTTAVPRSTSTQAFVVAQPDQVLPPTYSNPVVQRPVQNSPSRVRSIPRTPERLSTVPEVPSTDGITSQHPNSPTPSNPSRRSSRHRTARRTTSSSTAASDKASKRRAVEQAEEELRLSRQNSAASAAAAISQARRTPSRASSSPGAQQNRGSPPHSRQSTPPQGPPQSTPRTTPTDRVRSTRGSAKSAKSAPASKSSSSSSTTAATSTSSSRARRDRRDRVDDTRDAKSDDRDRRGGGDGDGDDRHARRQRRSATRTPSVRDRKNAILRTLQIISTVPIAVPVSQRGERRHRADLRGRR